MVTLIYLQGIETILLFLNEKDKKSSSIRNISEQTGLSMRVVKNIFLQLFIEETQEDLKKIN